MGGWVPNRTGRKWRPWGTTVLVVIALALWTLWPRGARGPELPRGGRPVGPATEAVLAAEAEEPVAEEPQVLPFLPEEEVAALAVEDVRVEPAPPSASTEAISAAEALQVALEEFGLPKGMDAWKAAEPGTTLTLCRFTDLDMGRELSDGTVDLAHDDEPVWLVTISDVEFPIHPPPDKAHLYPHHYLADMVVVVDASTGRFIMAMSVNPQ